MAIKRPLSVSSESIKSCKTASLPSKSGLLDPILSETQDADIKKPPKLPKKKMACLIGYCGSNYQGLQYNPGQLSIEGEFFKAFVKAGAVAEYNADNPKKVSLARAARTDKGVHAAINAITAKLIDMENIEEKINSYLPSSLRVWKIYRVLSAFDPRVFCDSRIYQYFIPTHCFIPPNPNSALSKKFYENRNDAKLLNHEKSFREFVIWQQEQFWSRVDCRAKEIFCAFTDQDKLEVKESLKEHKSSSDIIGSILRKKAFRKAENEARNLYRINNVQLDAMKLGIKLYEGSHNFHNYTLKKPFTDASANRNILSFTVSEPQIIEDIEWISFKVHGQSFMLHQIRKMIAMLVYCVRLSTSLNRISEAYQAAKVNIPKIPSLGLLLEKPLFEKYSQRAIRFDRPKIETVDIDFSEELQRFKTEHIYYTMHVEEKKNHIFASFCNFLDNELADLLLYLTDQGINLNSTNVKDIAIDFLETKDYIDNDEYID